MDEEKMYRVYYMRVYSYVMTLCRAPDKAEEITEETFFRAICAGKRKNTEYRGTSDEVTWLCAIAKNLWIDEVRRTRRFCDLPPDFAAPDDVGGSASDKEDSIRIHLILQSLETPYREVFEWRVYGDMPFSVIGKKFGKTETWARVTYHRAKLRIRERMGLYGTKL